MNEFELSFKEFRDWQTKNKPNISSKDAWNYQQAKIDELQERIDGAISILTGMRHNGAYRALDILKGESNDH